MIDLHTFCVFFVGMNQLYVLCLLQLLVFQGLALVCRELFICKKLDEYFKIYS